MIAMYNRIGRMIANNYHCMGDLDLSYSEEELREEIENGRKFKTSCVHECNEEVCKWLRIRRLIKRVENVFDVEDLLLDGNEYGIRAFVKKVNPTKKELVSKAKNMNIPYYGWLSKKELINAIRDAEKNQTTRQKFERINKGVSSF